MKTALDISTTHATRTQFPALYQSTTGSRFVVFFWDEQNGVVVHCPNFSLFSVGEVVELNHSTVNDASEWERLPAGSQVTFAQE